jgi:membrane protein DedA with SNARE-associated domain/membrane-associated phospholipid phosphatase
MNLDFIQPLLDWVSQHPAWSGLFVFLVAFSESLAVVGLFMPGAVLMFAFGALIALGTIDFWPTFWLAVVGAAAGDGLSFWLGHHFKDRLRSLWPFSRYPALFEKGVEFFNRHGGKSILFGRFVGPVRPIIPVTAGMLGMPGWRFLFVNLLSALGWAPAYLVPGMVFGASLGLAAAVATRLAIMVLLLVALLWLGVWLVRSSYRLLAPQAGELAERLIAWGRGHHRLGQITAAIVDPQQPELKGLSILALILLLLALLMFILFREFTIIPALARLDGGLYNLLQGLRTPWGDQLMTTISQLGDGVVQSVLVIAVLLWLLVRRRFLAAGHWLAAALFALVMTWLLKEAVEVPRPSAMYQGVMEFSFPSAHTVYASCIFGFLAVLIARELKPQWRTACYAVAILLILSIAFSRLYLGAHWFSDVAGGLLLGLAWVLALGVAYRRHVAPPVKPAGLIVVPLLVLLSFGSWHVVDTHTEDMQRYARQYHIKQMAFADWRGEGWRQLPPYRIDTLGTQGQPLNLQWAGPLDEFKQHMLALGWQEPAPLTMADALRWLQPNATLAELVPLPHVHDGRHASLTLELVKQKLIIKLWPADYTLTPSGQPLWVGYIARLKLADLPLITIPTLSPDFDTPMQQFKPFAALLNWRLGYRHRLDNDDDFWKGEVLLMWSEKADVG